MKKMLVLLILVAVFISGALNALAADVQPPVISDITTEGLPFKTKASNQKLTFRFTSDQKPTDVLVNFIGVLYRQNYTNVL